MPKYFSKTLSCGCVVQSIVTGIKSVDTKVLYMMGGHDHIKMCKICNEYKVNGIDTLFDLWLNDNITDGSGNDGWIKESYYIPKIGV